MNQILITGATGFLGRNLATHLSEPDSADLFLFDVDNSAADLHEWLSDADIVFHLAGVNRPNAPGDFEAGNADFTQTLVNTIRQSERKPHIVFSSSIQAALDNPYGRSKRQAEQILERFASETDTPVSIFRLKNIFGKWCRPNYNSVVATFCHNIAHDLPIQVSDPERELELVYVDDVVEAFIREMEEHPERPSVFVDPDTIPSNTITLGDLAGRLQFFRQMQQTLQVPDFSVPFNKQLYATYLSYVPVDRWEYGPQIKADERGNLAELVKSPHFGQIFVSRTKPGITRGNHYHHTKTEKFIVISGEGLIRFRQTHGTEILEYPVCGEDYRIVEIPPGYTHSISNTGATEMITLFWASEPFDPDRPDTCFMPVEPEHD